jgi:hypothetical protein
MKKAVITLGLITFYTYCATTKNQSFSKETQCIDENVETLLFILRTADFETDKIKSEQVNLRQPSIAQKREPIKFNIRPAKKTKLQRQDVKVRFKL